MNNIFELVSNSREQVVLKVNAKDPLTVALNPYVQSNYEYITVTKGPNHTMSVINNEGKRWSIEWGERGHTLIGASTERLKQEVLKYIGSLDISIEYQGQPVKQVNVFYHSFFKKWEISITPTFGPHIAHFSVKATNLEDIKAEAEAIIPFPCKGWKPYTSSNGFKCITMIF